MAAADFVFVSTQILLLLWWAGQRPAMLSYDSLRYVQKRDAGPVMAANPVQVFRYMVAPIFIGTLSLSLFGAARAATPAEPATPVESAAADESPPIAQPTYVESAPTSVEHVRG